MGSILRTMLFIPANSWRMILRARDEMEDAVILDLEDAVPIGEKETARVLARDCIPLLKERAIDVFIRVNSLATGLTREDLNYVVVEGADGIVLPKSESKQDILALDEFLQDEERKKGLEPNSVAIMPLVETPRGVLNVRDIVSASPRVIAVGFGAGDFLRELGEGFAITRLTPEEYFPMILYARSSISLAASAAGILPIDTPFFGLLTDTEGLIAESEKAKLLGFKGKMLIHPRHINPVNEIFSPSEADIDFARQMVQAYKEAEARGLGAASFGGRMIDYAMHTMGMDLLAKAEAIAEKSQRRLRVSSSAGAATEETS
ncbi:MAG TPA: CoA ester lyase [Dehalococcoidia bacterium]|jgi:citrate lyase subunit beta/citryl-CoA lyase|nr:CoA ester lyase [Dehalococcoidia bacterium]